MILLDPSFPEHIRRVAGPAFHSDNDSNNEGHSGMADFAAAEMTLHTLAALEEDSTTFSSFETPSYHSSDEDTFDTQSVRSSHRPINDTSNVRATKTHVQTPLDNPRGDEEDMMSYPYPKYDKPDVEAHIRAFLTTW